MEHAEYGQSALTIVLGDFLAPEQSSLLTGKGDEIDGMFQDELTLSEGGHDREHGSDSRGIVVGSGRQPLGIGGVLGGEGIEVRSEHDPVRRSAWNGCEDRTLRGVLVFEQAYLLGRSNQAAHRSLDPLRSDVRRG